MYVLNARNAHQALPMALGLLAQVGRRESSRNGDVLVSPEPVVTRYQNPTERVEFHSWRDANPFFHFAESLWMLGGRDEIAFLTRFVGRMKNFSDDGTTHHGAYGRRWRRDMPADRHPDKDDHDQLATIVKLLRNDPSDRRAVLQFWDARSDLDKVGAKDVPCNLTATFRVLDGALRMQVFNRSNDVIWGCYGANVVHLSMMQEYVACSLGLACGPYHQLSMNWHAYDDVLGPLSDRFARRGISDNDLYSSDGVRPFPLINTSPEEWDLDCGKLLKANGRAPVGQFADEFFGDVAIPILRAHDQYKDGKDESRFDRALAEIDKCHATDWRTACTRWLLRRHDQFRKDADDGPAA